MNNNKDEIVLFENGELALEVNVSPQLETVWLSSNQMALLYGCLLYTSPSPRDCS